jgi:hypothetical protein
MPPPYKLYIDRHGIKRGYYVYVHKDCASGEVFYVGKGHGQRAWKTKCRNSKWESKVTSLSDGWQVEIVQDDLSENEAFDLEISLIQKYGGPQALGGKLTNEALGGESSLEIHLGFQFDDNDWSKAYFDARLFNQLPREKEEALVNEYNESLSSVYHDIESFKDEAFNQDDEKLIELADNLECFAGSLMDFNRDFLRRRISWKELAISVEDIIEDIEFDLEEEQMYHGDTRSVLESLLRVAVKFLTKIDSGNKKAAEETANRETGKA